MEIVCCPDKHYIMPCGIMLKSLCENNNSNPIRIHLIIDDDVDDKDKSALLNIVEPYIGKTICFYNIGNLKINDFPALNGSTHIKKAAYYRLFLTDILPPELEKVLYLDGDIIIEKNLENLWNTNIEEYAAGGVIEQEIDNIEFYNRLQYSHEFGYFNSGVLLINLSYWRQHKLSQLFSEFIVKYHERIKYHDQDVMNYVLKGQILYLPLKYNVQSAFFFKKDLIKIDLLKYGQEIDEAKKDPYIIHFSTRYKPWLKDCFHPLRNEFIKYKNMTEWKNVNLAKEYLPNRSIKAMIGDFLRLLKIRKPILKQKSKDYFCT